MQESALLGYARAFVRGPRLDWQIALLRDHGVTERRLYVDEKPAKRSEQRPHFREITRALRIGDTLAVPCFAVFGRNREEVMHTFGGLELRSIRFWSITDKIDTRRPDDLLLAKLGSSMQRANGIWDRERTVWAKEMAGRGHRMGRRPTLGPHKEKEARALWLDPESDKTSEEIAALVGLSAGRLYAKFGKRWRP